MVNIFFLLLLVSSYVAAMDVPKAISPQLAPRSSRQFCQLFDDSNRSMSDAMAKHLIADAPKGVREMVSHLKKLGTVGTPRMLLFGAPGYGKTSLALAIAQETKRRALFIDSSTIADQYQNSGSQNLKLIFNQALNDHNPQVLIFDEVNRIIDKPNKDEFSRVDPAVVTTFWECLDACLKCPDILVIGTTNKIDSIPEQIKTRFATNIFKISSVLDISKRVNIFKFHLNQYSHTIDDKVITQVARETTSLCPREIHQLILKAVDFARFKNNLNPIITDQDLQKALKRINEVHNAINPSCTTLGRIQTYFSNGLRVTPTVIQTVLACLSLYREGVNFNTSQQLLQLQLRLAQHAYETREESMATAQKQLEISGNSNAIARESLDHQKDCRFWDNVKYYGALGLSGGTVIYNYRVEILEFLKTVISRIPHTAG